MKYKLSVLLLLITVIGCVEVKYDLVCNGMKINNACDVQQNEHITNWTQCDTGAVVSTTAECTVKKGFK